MITLENLLWLRDTKLGEVASLMNAVVPDMEQDQREEFLQSLWQDVSVMRHLR